MVGEILQVSAQPMAATIFSTTFVMYARFLAFVSISANSHSLKFGNVSRSRTQLLVNCKLPAPINEIFFITFFPFVTVIYCKVMRKTRSTHMKSISSGFSVHSIARRKSNDHANNIQIHG